VNIDLGPLWNLFGLSGFISAGGLKTYYEEHGSGEPLVMLHGDITNAESFSCQIPAFAARFRVIIPERRGHGRTPDLPGDYTYQLFAKDTIAFMDSLGLRHANLLGDHGGANIALLIAVSRPDLVSKLIAISGQSGHELTDQQKKYARSVTPEDFRRRFPTIVEMYERVAPNGRTQFPHFFEKIRALAITDWRIPDKELGSIAASTLIMLGDRDVVSIEDATAMSRKIPGSQLCVIPGAGLGLTAEKPDLVNRIILFFLEGEQKT